MKIWYVFPVSLFLILFACQTYQAPKSSPPADYFGSSVFDTHISFSTDQRGLCSSALSGKFKADVLFSCDSCEVAAAHAQLFANDQVFEEMDKANLFGRMLDLTFVKKATSQLLAERSFYVPPPLCITSFPTKLHKQQAAFSEPIRWEPDMLSPKSIVIRFSYRPLEGGKAKTNYSTVEDKGIYQITAEDLNGFPNDARISVHLSRWNQDSIVLENEKILLDARSNWYGSIPVGDAALYPHKPLH